MAVPTVGLSVHHAKEGLLGCSNLQRIISRNALQKPLQPWEVFACHILANESKILLLGNLPVEIKRIWEDFSLVHVDSFEEDCMPAANHGQACFSLLGH